MYHQRSHELLPFQYAEFDGIILHDADFLGLPEIAIGAS